MESTGGAYQYSYNIYRNIYAYYIKYRYAEFEKCLLFDEEVCYEQL